LNSLGTIKVGSLVKAVHPFGALGFAEAGLTGGEHRFYGRLDNIASALGITPEKETRAPGTRMAMPPES